VRQQSVQTNHYLTKILHNNIYTDFNNNVSYALNYKKVFCLLYPLQLTSFCRQGLQSTPATCYGFCHHQQSGNNKHCIQLTGTAQNCS